MEQLTAFKDLTPAQFTRINWNKFRKFDSLDTAVDLEAFVRGGADNVVFYYINIFGSFFVISGIDGVQPELNDLLNPFEEIQDNDPVPETHDDVWNHALNRVVLMIRDRMNAYRQNGTYLNLDQIENDLLALVLSKTGVANKPEYREVLADLTQLIEMANRISPTNRGNLSWAAFVADKIMHRVLVHNTENLRSSLLEMARDTSDNNTAFALNALANSL